MARKNRMKDRGENPSKYFFEWSSTNQKFRHYKKATKEYISVNGQFKFLALSKYITVSGWNEKLQISLKANEVKRGGRLVVRGYPRGRNGSEVLAQGFWPDIKDIVDQKAGKWTQSIYVMFPNGELGNIQLSGSALRTWFEFQKNQSDRFKNDWVVVNGFEHGQMGSNKFTYPIFEWGTSLSPEDQNLADIADALLEPYELTLIDSSHPEERIESDQTPNRERSEVNKYEADHQQKVAAELEMHNQISQGNDSEFNPFKSANEERARVHQEEEDDDVPF